MEALNLSRFAGTMRCRWAKTVADVYSGKPIMRRISGGNASVKAFGGRINAWPAITVLPLTVSVGEPCS
jgi:hypothetical protein